MKLAKAIIPLAASVVMCLALGACNQQSPPSSEPPAAQTPAPAATDPSVTNPGTTPLPATSTPTPESAQPAQTNGPAPSTSPTAPPRVSKVKRYQCMPWRSDVDTASASLRSHYLQLHHRGHDLPVVSHALPALVLSRATFWRKASRRLRASSLSVVLSDFLTWSPLWVKMP